MLPIYLKNGPASSTKYPHCRDKYHLLPVHSAAADMTAALQLIEE
jgi:hypothetical protein